MLAFLPAAAVYGLGTSWVPAPADGSFWLSNVSAPYLVVPFLAGLAAPVSWWAAALLGVGVDWAMVVGLSAFLGEFPDPGPEEATAWQEMLDTFTGIDATLVESGVRAAAEVDLDAWGPALDQYHRRRMVGLQVANTHRIMLQDFMGGEYLGHEFDPPVKTRLHEIAAPLSVLVGRRDFRGSQLWARRIADQAPDATLTVIPEADHFPMFSAPHEFERFLRDALR